MEDIKLIGIDFRANQRRIRNEILKKEKKERKINKLLNGAIFLGLAVAVIGILFINKNMTDSAMESCQNMGNTYEYCIAHI